MSQANVELVKNLYDAFGRRDMATIGKLVAGDIEITQSPELPWGGEYHGLEGLGKFFATLMAHVKSTLVFERFLDAGDHIVAIGRTRGTVVASGREFDVPIAHVWEVRDGLIVHFRPFIDNPTMLAALADGTKSNMKSPSP
jgi:ketosteroid isomerase-like protein